MTDISAILTTHREGILAGVTAQNALKVIEDAERRGGLKVELLVMLDRSDELTRDVLTNVLAGRASFHHTDLGDPGQARNAGVALAQGRFSTFLDGDDLWSENWLTKAAEAASARPDAVHHSQCNIVFGMERNIWWHVDSEGALYDPAYMSWQNYWDAMSFAETALYRRLPFRANDLAAGFGHEDWHWNRVTLQHGIAHKPVPGTIHFKRRRRGSQMGAVHKSDATIWPEYG